MYHFLEELCILCMSGSKQSHGLKNRKHVCFITLPTKRHVWYLLSEYMEIWSEPTFGSRLQVESDQTNVLIRWELQKTCCELSKAMGQQRSRPSNEPRIVAQSQSVAQARKALDFGHLLDLVNNEKWLVNKDIVVMAWIVLRLQRNENLKARFLLRTTSTWFT